MALLLNEQEIALLEKYPDTVVIAKKLKGGEWISKGEYDDVLLKQSELSEMLTQVEVDKQASVSKSHEIEVQLQSEKAVADQYRQFIKEKKSAFKVQFGDQWLPEYETDSFSIGSLEKVAERVLRGSSPGTVTVPPGKQQTTKRLSEMTVAERESVIAKAKVI